MFNERLFKSQMVLMGYTAKALCDELGMLESTFYRKVKADGAFTRDEMNKMIDILKFPDPMAVFFAQELAGTQEKR